ncbi:MAG: serine/threonine protein kinase [Acidobacteriota bacterium]
MKLCPKCQKQFSDDANFCPVDAARLVPIEMGSTQAGGPDSLTSRFELGERLGGSRTGQVLRAVDKTTRKPCVIKLVARAVVALPGVAQRLERELKQLERVQSTGVCKVLASGKRGDETWIATELLEGAHTLADAITARGPIPAEQAAELIEVIGEALIEAAQVGVVHRDLAPKNVLFAGSDVKLINFSLPVPTTDRVPGVPEFVAPEQVDGRPVDQRSNLYSLGALYYYLLTGSTVFDGTPEQVLKLHQSGTIRPPSQLVPVPPQVEGVILRALDRSPTKRFLTVRQFVDEVTRVGHGEIIELKQTMAMGKAGGRPKGELVQTLMGISKGMLPIARPAAKEPSAGQTIQSMPPAAVAAPPAAAPRPAGMQAATVVGVPSADRPVGGQPVATSPAGPMGMTALTPPPQQPLAPPQPSPWAPPAHQQPTQIAVQPPVAQPMPQPAPPQPAAPILAAPVVATASKNAPTAQGKKKAGDEGGGKGKFRETMWFKKGDLDAEAAQAAADEAARTGKAVDKDKADSLPIDERYKDDGTISRTDKEKYSLRTGATQMMSAVQDRSRGGGTAKGVSEDALVSEMKGGRTIVLIAIVIGIAAIAGIIYLVAG